MLSLPSRIYDGSSTVDLKPIWLLRCMLQMLPRRGLMQALKPHLHFLRDDHHAMGQVPLALAAIMPVLGFYRACRAGGGDASFGSVASCLRLVIGAKVRGLDAIVCDGARSGAVPLATTMGGALGGGALGVCWCPFRELEWYVHWARRSAQAVEDSLDGRDASCDHRKIVRHLLPQGWCCREPREVRIPVQVVRVRETGNHEGRASVDRFVR